MEPKPCPDCGGTETETTRYGTIVCADCGYVLDDSNYEPPEPDGEVFRGTEAASYTAEQQAWIQRNLK